MDLGLNDRVALITGGSRGIGRSIALELVREGAKVAICARNASSLYEAAEEIVAESLDTSRVLAIPADVTREEDVEQLIARVVEHYGRLDILVNNAGRATPGRFNDLTDDAWATDLDTKLFSLIRCCRAAIPHLRAAGDGRIVNINSIFGKEPDPTFFATSTNRAACLAFSKALAAELAPYVLVNSVNIGFVETPQWHNIHERRAPEQSRDVFFGAMARRYIPLGRFGQPDEVAGVVAFVFSRRAIYITGAYIVVGGVMGNYL
jgi:NAD(P)-dependent dehydrogenase (short-subunit alcohol dehydrogenase family)